MCGACYWSAGDSAVWASVVAEGFAMLPSLAVILPCSVVEQCIEVQHPGLQCGVV